jgi:uncharacterized protein YjiS (DUF1127 family)
MAALQPRPESLPAPPGAAPRMLTAAGAMLRRTVRGLARAAPHRRHSFAELDRHLLRDIGLTPVEAALRRARR